tara:strand:- start:31814 stop:32059 length:246 start_codon:yes stop_codon:yes gene_type:complete
MKILRLKQVLDLTGLARATVYRYMADGLFPRNVKLGIRSVGWVESEVVEWIQAQIEVRDSLPQSRAISLGSNQGVSNKAGK